MSERFTHRNWTVPADFEQNTDFNTTGGESLCRTAISNVKVEKKKELSKELTKVIELIPGKTENWIMTSIDDEAVMSFAGTDDPCALITLKTYGEPAQQYYDMVTEGFTKTVSQMLKIRPDRIYVDHEPIAHWGWNGANF